MFAFAGKRPTNLGVQAGRLPACPGTPNCVCSQDSDPEYTIAPLTYQSTPAAALAALKQIVETSERAQVISQTENYLYAEFTSKLMGFVDDVEFYLDPAAKVIHVRSASRLGKSDLGVNRKRVELIREKLAATGV
jgi:uncharacterized protein (DUF1499 family)